MRLEDRPQETLDQRHISDDEIVAMYTTMSMYKITKKTGKSHYVIRGILLRKGVTLRPWPPAGRSEQERLERSTSSHPVTPEMLAFGRMIQDLRESLGMTAREFATTCSIHPSVLSRLERGERLLRLGRLYKVLDAAGMSVQADREKFADALAKAGDSRPAAITTEAKTAQPGPPRTTPHSVQLGAALRRKRLAAGVSLEAMGATIGAESSHICHAESGERLFAFDHLLDYLHACEVADGDDLLEFVTLSAAARKSFRTTRK